MFQFRLKWLPQILLVISPKKSWKSFQTKWLPTSLLRNHFQRFQPYFGKINSSGMTSSILHWKLILQIIAKVLVKSFRVQWLQEISYSKAYLKLASKFSGVISSEMTRRNFPFKSTLKTYAKIWSNPFLWHNLNFFPMQTVHINYQNLVKSLPLSNFFSYSSRNFFLNLVESIQTQCLKVFSTENWTIPDRNFFFVCDEITWGNFEWICGEIMKTQFPAIETIMCLPLWKY